MDTFSDLRARIHHCFMFLLRNFNPWALLSGCEMRTVLSLREVLVIERARHCGVRLRLHRHSAAVCPGRWRCHLVRSRQFFLLSLFPTTSLAVRSAEKSYPGKPPPPWSRPRTPTPRRRAFRRATLRRTASKRRCTARPAWTRWRRSIWIRSGLRWTDRRRPSRTSRSR